MTRNFWTQQVNFIISIAFIGSFALLGIVLVLENSDMENPIANHMAAIEVEMSELQN
jgi:hypothetical protein